MQCINKIKAGFHKSGTGITFKPRENHPELAGFEIECRKCLPCRLNIAREKSIRAYHEAQVHGANNIFLTLTYSDDHLKSPWLQYKDFQLFMYKLREHVTRDIQDSELKKEMAISVMVTGEYGDRNKRPHFHALLFNYRPHDLIPGKPTELGHKTWTSHFIDTLWGKNDPKLAPSIIGEITLDSASYVARYAAKKLTHGKDQEHNFHPIHKTSSRNAIGKRWIEKYWKQTFDLGYVNGPKGEKLKIPRYYVDWFKKNHPDEWRQYIQTIRQQLQEQAQKKSREEELNYLIELINTPQGHPRPICRKKVKLTILNQKFKRLQETLKL